jgi:hypothetical protein
MEKQHSPRPVISAVNFFAVSMQRLRRSGLLEITPLVGVEPWGPYSWAVLIIIYVVHVDLAAEMPNSLPQVSSHASQDCQMPSTRV